MKETYRVAIGTAHPLKPALSKVLGDISPVVPALMRYVKDRGVLAAVDAVAVHCFPPDRNH